MTNISRLTALAGIDSNAQCAEEQNMVEGNALVWYDLAPLGDDADLYAELDELLAADAGHNSTQLPNDSVHAASADPRTSAARRPDSHIGIPISYKQTLDWLDTVGASILDESNESKPDFADIDGDGDKEEDMKKAAKDKEKVDEANLRPYVCVHAKKGTHECQAGSSYEAAKKAAAHWKLKSTAGIDAHLADVEKVATEALEEMETMLRNAGLGEEAISAKLAEWANSINANVEDRGHQQEQPAGETVDLSLRRYLDATAQPVKVVEDHTEDSMIREYEEFKKAEQLDELSPETLGSYIYKSDKDEKERLRKGIETRDEIRKQTGLNFGTPIDRKLYSPIAGREANRRRAMDKLTGKAKINAKPKR